MAVENLGPLDWRIPIVTTDGRPTAEFQRRWATQVDNNTDIGEPGDPTAIAKDTAVVGVAATFMRSDSAPAVQKATSAQFGLVKVDGTTITETGGVISSAGGGGGLVLITETTTSGSAANVSFTSIPGTYRDLTVRIRGRTNTPAVTFVNMRMRFNGDTGANYDSAVAVTNGGGGTFFSGGAAQTSIWFADLPAATATANASGMCILDIADYRSTTFWKSTNGRSTHKLTNINTGMNQMTSGGAWRSTAAITQIDVFPATSTFTDNTIVSLYGHL